MIDKNKFYHGDELPGKSNRKKMWKGIEDNLRVEKKRFFKTTLDTRSFVYGMAFTIIVSIFVLAAVRFVPGIVYDNKSDDVKINRAYSKAAEELERSIPNFISTLDKSERTRELLDVRLEELNYINDAINQYKNTLRQSDLTKIKQERLLELYQMKIDAINKIIQLKGDSWL